MKCLLLLCGCFFIPGFVFLNSEVKAPCESETSLEYIRVEIPETLSRCTICLSECTCAHTQTQSFKLQTKLMK